jgi:BirA family transcriptional regulator, biotin operon repressor / biotin---[acetyl-CoA-carboxylase] ligase
MPARQALSDFVKPVQQALAPLLVDVQVQWLAQVDSTNSELMRRARCDRLQAQTPTLLVAQQQTGGRGRMGRQWHGQPGQLTFSLGMPMEPPDWSGLSLAVGCAVAESLHPQVQLKWPNDLWVDGCKLGGILIETASLEGTAARYCVIGVGINIMRPVALNDDTLYRTPPIGLTDLLPQADAGTALLQLAPTLALALLAFNQAGFAPFEARFMARDALRERAVQLSDSTEGTAHGVDETGALLVLGTHGMQRVTSAEISVRPMARAGHG